MRLSSYHASLAGSADGMQLYDTVRGQVEKLAALYVVQNGMDATSAAKQATDDLLNFKYVYQDGYRVPGPKSRDAPPQSLDDIRLGAYVARAALGTTIHGIDPGDTAPQGRWGTNKEGESVFFPPPRSVEPHSIDLSVKRPVDTFGRVYTQAQLEAEVAATKRNGHWVTNGDETGLWYVYRGQIVYRPDGSPLQLTWAQLGALAKHYRDNPAEAPIPGRQAAGEVGQRVGEALAGPAPLRNLFGMSGPAPVMGGNPLNAAGQPGAPATQSGQAPPSGRDRALEELQDMARRERGTFTVPSDMRNQHDARLATIFAQHPDLKTVWEQTRRRDR